MSIYQQFNIWHTTLDLEVMEKRKAQLREHTSLKPFLKMCENATEMEAEKIDFAAEYDAPPALFGEVGAGESNGHEEVRAVCRGGD